METFSEGQSDRAVLVFRGLDGCAATVIVMRRRGQVWLVFHGAEKTTVVMSDTHAARLIEALGAASRGP
ncbi:MAG: hypothetical protein ACRDSP_26760 [Pseudonocardiaceae bacterium]